MFSIEEILLLAVRKEMVSDSTFSYIHMGTQDAMIFIDSWENQELKWDEVEFSNVEDVDQHDNLLEQFLSQQEEPNTSMSLAPNNNPIFNSSYANRMKQKSRKLNWKDVDIDSFLTHAKNKNGSSNHIHDQTILKNPNLGGFSGDAELDSMLGLNRAVPINNGSMNDVLIDIDNLHQSSLNLETDFEMDKNNIDIDYNIDNDMAVSALSRNILNADVSRSFSHQFTTPVVNNRVYSNNYQSSINRNISSQQRRQVSDTSMRNVSYHSPRRENIR